MDTERYQPPSPAEIYGYRVPLKSDVSSDQIEPITISLFQHSRAEMLSIALVSLYRLGFGGLAV